MRERLRSHLTYANVISTLALFLVLSSGVAYAANTVFSTDIVDGEVKTQDLALNSVNTGRIANGGVESVDLKDNAGVKSADVVDDTATDGGLVSADIRNGEVRTGEVRDNALRSADVLNDSLTGTDVDESSLGEVPSALLGGFGRSGAVVSCDPEAADFFVNCAGTEILDVPPGARALVLGRVRARADADANFGQGDCHLTTSSIGEVVNSFQEFRVDNASNGYENGTLVAVTPPLPAGATSFGIDCREGGLPAGGGIRYFDVSASVVLISDD
jgi:hypothetical protein